MCEFVNIEEFMVQFRKQKVCVYCHNPEERAAVVHYLVEQYDFFVSEFEKDTVYWKVAYNEPCKDIKNLCVSCYGNAEFEFDIAPGDRSYIFFNEFLELTNLDREITWQPNPLSVLYQAVM